MTETPPPADPSGYVTPQQVAAWVGTTADDPDGVLAIVTATTNVTIKDMIGSATVAAEVAKHAALALASDLYEQRNAPNGIRMFTDAIGQAAPIRVRADSAARARAILRLGPAIG